MHKSIASGTKESVCTLISVMKTIEGCHSDLRMAPFEFAPYKGGEFKHAYRLHTQFEVLRGVPNRIDVTSANPKGPADERAV